ncbi:MAG: MBG domain-containing protein [Candidatus Coproplasma sp.]
MSNKSEMTYTSINIRNSKFLLITGITVAVVIDALITALLCLGGYSFKFIAFPAVLLLLDAVYLTVGATATNYRFKYSLAVWLLYVLLTCTACASGSAILLKVEGTVLTDIALILWIAVHAVSVICAIVTALYTSKKFKSVVFTVLITLLLSAVCAFYAVFLFTKGFFGQGYGLRTLVYDYDAANDCYTVSGVLSGNSEKVEIEKTFNGKPVTAIDCKVLTENTVKEYILHDDFTLIDTYELASGSVEGKSILVDTQYATSFRSKLFDCAQGLQNRANALALANATVPYGMEEDRGYVAFDYDETAYVACGGNVLPLVMGDKGQTIFLTDYASTYEYLNHTDKNSVADLKWGYENSNGHILDGIYADGNSLGGGYVLGSGVNAKVEFERVYRIYVQSGNDTKYDLRTKQTQFCCDELNGAALDYRYIAAGNADSFFNNFTQREGFTLAWKYGEGSTAGNTLSTLAEAFETIEGSNLTLCPEWTLNNPTVELQSKYTITYGENVTFTANATSPATGVALVYEWKHSGINVGAAKDLSLTTPSLSGEYDGQYVLTVTTDGGEVTSLTSSAQSYVNLTINKKTISFGWVLPEENDRVYSGTAKTVTATFDDAQLVSGDSLDYNLSGFTSATANCTDAGNYSFAVEIDSASSKNYQVDSTRTNSLTITPLPVEVVWSNYEFIYNGLTQTPTASALGVSGQQLVSGVNGGQTNAGTHMAKAYCTDGNYLLTESNKYYTIAKAPLTITANDCTIVYGGLLLSQGSGYEGFVNNETVSNLDGTLSYTFTNFSKNVGVYENSVEISGLSSINYDITFVPGNLEIIQRAVTAVTWENASGLVYNGESKNVTATISNKVGSDDVTAVVTGGNQVNAGSYTAQITSLSGSSAGNYKLIEVLTKSYTIEKAAVTITPDDITVTYGDIERELTSTQTGDIYNNDFTYTLSREEGDIVRSYIISVNLSGDYANYVVTCNQGNYVITKRPVTLTWSGYKNLVYDGTAKNVTATLNNTIEGDDVYLEISNGNAKTAGNYTATSSLAGDMRSNYNLISEKELDYTIAPRPVTLTWSGYENLVYDGTAKNVTAILNNVVDGEKVSAIITNGNAKNAGGYTATAALSGTAAKNYIMASDNSLVYTIAKAKITLKADNATSVYGQPIAKLSVSLTGTIYNNEVNYYPQTSVNSSSPVGEYDIAVVVVGTYDDYDITVWNGTYTITKATPQLDGFTDGSYTVSGYVEYGTTLGDVTAMLPTQSVSGSWLWGNGESATVGEAGSNTFNVVFIPTDTNNYNSVTAVVTINVKAADPVVIG